MNKPLTETLLGQDAYKEVREFKYSNAVVRVHIPDLTEEERERRMKAVKIAAENLMKEVIKQC